MERDERRHSVVLCKIIEGDAAIHLLPKRQDCLNESHVARPTDGRPRDDRLAGVAHTTSRACGTDPALEARGTRGLSVAADRLGACSTARTIHGPRSASVGYQEGRAV